MLPSFLQAPATYIVAGQPLPRTAFGEIAGNDMVADIAAGYARPNDERECSECAQHCPVGYVPQPTQVYHLHNGRAVCALCYQINRTAQQIRRLRPNTIHVFHMMQQLELMELHAEALQSEDELLKSVVLPWSFITNRHGVPVQPHPAPPPATNVSSLRPRQALPPVAASSSTPTRQAMTIDEISAMVASSVHGPSSSSTPTVAPRHRQPVDPTAPMRIAKGYGKHGGTGDGW